MKEGWRWKYVVEKFPKTDRMVLLAPSLHCGVIFDLSLKIGPRGPVFLSVYRRTRYAICFFCGHVRTYTHVKFWSQQVFRRYAQRACHGYCIHTPVTTDTKEKARHPFSADCSIRSMLLLARLGRLVDRLVRSRRRAELCDTIRIPVETCLCCTDVTSLR